MGLIRGAAVFFFGVLLFLSLFVMVMLATISSSLSYENVQAQISPVLLGTSDMGLPEEIAENLNLSNALRGQSSQILAYCTARNVSEVGFSFEGYSVNISCAAAGQGDAAVVNEMANNLLYGIYHTQYDCDFWECMSESSAPFFLLSAEAQSYWKAKFWLALIVSFALAALLVLFMDNRINAPIVLGIHLGLAALPLIKFDSILAAVAPKEVEYIIGIFFTQSSKVFWISFIIAIILVILGIAMKLMNLDFIKNLMQKKDSGGSVKPAESQSKQNQNQASAKKKKK